MPNLSAQASLFRGGYEYDGYLSTPAETVVISRAVNMPTITYPVTAITFDNPYSGSGSHTSVVEGMEVIVYSQNTATVKGRLRVAAGGASSTVLQVNEFSANRIVLADNDRIEVVNSFRLRDKLVAANINFNKDSRIAYTTQNEVVAPVVCSGGHVAAILTGDEVEIFFDGTASINSDPDSAPGLTHSWTAPGSVEGTGSSSAETFTWTSAGTYIVTHTVSDTSNAATSTQRIVVVIETPDSAIPIRVEEEGSTTRSGWRMRFSTFDSSAVARLPDGGMVIYHEDEYYNGTQASYGNRVQARSRVKFVGYIVSDTISLDAETGRITFEAESPLSILRQLPGFSQALTAVADPANWQQWKTPLRTSDMLLYLLRWHTTFCELFDLLLPQYNYNYPELFLQQQTPAAQLIELADAIDAYVDCDRVGTMVIAQDLNLIGTTARNAATTTFTLTDADILTIEVSRVHRSRVAQLTGLGFTTSGQPLKAVSGIAPLEGETFEQVDRLILSAQSGSDRALNERTSRREAKLNATRLGLPVARVVAKLRGGYDVFDPAYAEWVQLTIDRDVQGRQVTYTNARFTIESVEVEHDSYVNDFDVEVSFKRITLTLVGEMDAPPGVTILDPIVPEVPDEEPITITYPVVVIVPRIIPTWDGVNRPAQRIGVLNANTQGFAVIHLNSDFTYTTENMSTGLSGDGQGWAQDPFGYATQFVLTSTGLYRVSNVNSFSSWVLVANNAAIFGDAARVGHKILMTHNYRGYIAILSGQNMIAVSFNYGASWVQRRMSGGSDLYGTSSPGVSGSAADAAFSSWNSNTEGHMYSTCHLSLNSCRVNLSTDYGLSWTEILHRTGGTAGGSNIASIRVPHVINGVENRNGNNQLYYLFLRNLNAFEAYRRGTLVSSLGGQGGGGLLPAGAQHNFTHDGNIVAIARTSTTEARSIAVSSNGGASFTNITGLGVSFYGGFGLGGEPYIGITGFSWHSLWLTIFVRGYGGNGSGSVQSDRAVRISPDLGATVYNIVPQHWSGTFRVAEAGALLDGFQ